MQLCNSTSDIKIERFWGYMKKRLAIGGTERTRRGGASLRLAPLGADILVSRSPCAFRNRRGGWSVGGTSAKGGTRDQEGGGGGGKGAVSPVSYQCPLSHTLLLAMPSLLVLAGIMEKNGGYGGDLAGPGFGNECLLVPPEEEEDDSRALRVALGQLSLLGLGEGDDGAPAGGGGGSVQDRSNNNHHNHIPNDSMMLQGRTSCASCTRARPPKPKDGAAT